MMRLPQRFQYRETAGGSWKHGVCLPVKYAPRESWLIRAGSGFGSFDEDPWEMMGQLIGDVADFRWIDNDNKWNPVESTCCGIKFKSSLFLQKHLSVHR